MYEYRGHAVKINDADSLTVDVDLGLRSWVRGLPLRLYGIDAPARHTPEGQAATEYLTELLFPIPGHPVPLLVQTRKDRQEKYGRWLAVIYLGGGSGPCLNWHLVEHGHAVRWDGTGPRPLGDPGGPPGGWR